MRLAAAILALVLSGTAALAAPAGLSDAAVRRFLAGQEQAWNAGRLDAYFRNFTAGATFTDQTRTPTQTIVYGTSTLAQAQAVARHAPKSTDLGTVRSVTLTPDHKSARILGSKLTVVQSPGGPRRVCAQTDETVTWRGGAILSQGQTDTIVKCSAR